MKRGLAYLLVACGLILIFTNATIAEAESYTIDMNVDITDAFYTNLEKDESSLEDDIVTYFNIDLTTEIIEEKDEWETVEFKPGENSFDNLVLRIYLKVSLVLPSGLSFKYELKVSASIGLNEYCIYFYNHALESGLYKVAILGYTSNYMFFDYDELIFDPPGGTGDSPPPSMIIFAQ
jgi:hypothetical protein